MVLAAVLEADPRAGNQVLDGARHEDFAGPGKGRDAGADGNPDPHDLAVADLELAGLQAGTDLEADRPEQRPGVPGWCLAPVDDRELRDLVAAPGLERRYFDPARWSTSRSQLRSSTCRICGSMMSSPTLSSARSAAESGLAASSFILAA
jgi:hypothetical protein